MSKYLLHLLNRLHVILIIAGSILPILIIVRYMGLHSVNFPTFDELLTRLPLAVKVADGSFQWQDVFGLYGGTQHRLVFALIIAALSTKICNWCLVAESYLTVGIMTIVFLILVQLMRRHYVRLAPFLIVPVAWLLFSLHQGTIWTIPVYAVRLHTVFFFVVGLWALSGDSIRTRQLVLALIAAICATFAMSTGMIVWAALFIPLVLRNDYKIRYIIIWMAMGVLTIGLYLYDIPAAAYDEASGLMLLDLLRLSFAMLGAPFGTPNQVDITALLGAYGVILLLVNSIVIYRRTQWALLRMPWSMAAFAVIHAVLTTAARFQRGSYVVFRDWYVAPTMLFWIAVLIILAAGSATVAKTMGKRQYWLIAANGLLVVILAISFCIVTYQRSRVSSAFKEEIEACARSYPLTMNAYCMRKVSWFLDQVPLMLQQIAAHNLTMYAHPIYDFPPLYQVGSPVILDTQDAIRDDVLRHVYFTKLESERIWNTTAAANNPPAPATFMNALAETRQLWWVHMESQAEPSVTLPPLAGYDYALLADVPIYNTLKGYIRGYFVFEVPSEPVRFGDAVYLYDWLLSYPSTLGADDELILRSVWNTTTPLELNYSKTLVLLDNSSNRIANTDSVFTYPTNSWQTDKYYVDQQILEIPDNLAAGQYTVAISIYYYTAPDAPLNVNLGETSLFNVGTIHIK